VSRSASTLTGHSSHRIAWPKGLVEFLRTNPLNLIPVPGWCFRTGDPVLHKHLIAVSSWGPDHLNRCSSQSVWNQQSVPGW